MSETLDRWWTCSTWSRSSSTSSAAAARSDRRQRVFGGQVAGQALVAAGRTVPADRPVHSLHAYFIRPGDPTVPLVYMVDRVRDGRSFTTRRVSAIQHGKTIFTLSASFHHDEPGAGARRGDAAGAAAGIGAAHRRAAGEAGRGAHARATSRTTRSTCASSGR